MQLGQDDTCHIGAGDVGDAKDLFRHIAQSEAERQRQNRDASGVRPALVDDLERLVDHKAQHDRQRKERQRAQRHKARVAVRILEADHKGQHHDTDHVVDDRRAENGGAQLGFQLAQLLERFNGDRHAGGGHDHADKHCREKLRCADRRKAVKAHIQQRTADQRNQHAGAGDQQRLDARVQELFEVGAESCREHQQHHAQSGADVQKLIELDDAEHAGTHHESGDDLADDLRRLELARDQSEHLGEHHDDRQIL